jgi:hypothetical protein
MCVAGTIVEFDPDDDRTGDPLAHQNQCRIPACTSVCEWLPAADARRGSELMMKRSVSQSSN